eukprot:5243096-Ditylum_brightwellii.AAC.1
MHNPRHVSAHKQIARLIELNNYLMEFPMQPGVDPRKIDWKGILEVLENGVFTLWKFQMGRQGFNASSSTIKEFIKTCIHYKECESAMPETLVAA